jgi:hypothetical protein
MDDWSRPEWGDLGTIIAHTCHINCRVGRPRDFRTEDTSLAATQRNARASGPQDVPVAVPWALWHSAIIAQMFYFLGVEGRQEMSVCCPWR